MLCLLLYVNPPEFIGHLKNIITQMLERLGPWRNSEVSALGRPYRRSPTPSPVDAGSEPNDWESPF